MNPDNYDPLAAYLQPSLGDRLRAGLTDPEARLGILLTLVLALATAALYGGFLRNPLVLDDYNVLSESVLQALANSPPAIGPRWLSYLTFGVSYRLVGTDWLWYRLGNLLLHALTVVLAYRFYCAVLRLMHERPSGAALANDWLAFLGALWFAVHPVAVYGVGYLVERSIVMATLFTIAALYCYVVALERGKPVWFAGALICYFLALSSKEHAVMAPAVAMTLSMLLRKPALVEYRRHLLPAGLLVGLSAAVAVLFVAHQKSVLGAAYEPQAFEIFTQMRQRGMGPSLDNAFVLSVVTQAHLFFHYLQLWVVPYTGWMSIDIRQPFATGLAVWPYGLSTIAFLAYPVVAVLLIRKGGRWGLFGLGMAYPWILFLPELAVVRVQEIFVLYRSYLWMSGLPLALIALAIGAPRRIAVGAFSVLALLLFVAALNRLDTLSDHIKLWSDAIANGRGKLDQGAERAYFKRGLAYRDLGRNEEAITDFKSGYALQSSSLSAAESGDRGIMYFQFNHLVTTTENLQSALAASEEIRQHPGSAEAYLRRGKANLKLLRPLQAVNDFSEAIRLNPDNAGEALRNRAYVLFKSGGPAGPAAALEDLNRAISINPRFAKAYMTRGIVLVAQGNKAAGLADFDKAVSIAPGDAEIHFNRGNVYLLLRRYDEAFRFFGKAIELDPTLADAHLNRGGMLMLAGQLDEALQELNAALRINPDIENAYLNRAKIRLARGEKDGAMSDYEKALKLNHENKEALFQRGLLLADRGFIREARISLQRSCTAGSEAGCARLKELAG